ncbi:MAG: MATE family efflux transporter [Helicobacteraceae bacterium]|nr:MATE family efflux transporter [Helicobacteraceae bacterium]
MPFFCKDRASRVTSLALPAALGAFVDMTQVLIDFIMVGFLEVAATAAIGVALQFTGLFYVLMGVFYIGSNALMSRFFGAKEPENAARVFTTFTIAVLILSVPMFAAMSAFAAAPFALMESDLRVTELGASYLFALSFALPAMMLNQIAFSLFSAAADIKRPLVIKIYCNIINVVLSYILIFGFEPLGIAAFGVAGAAAATAIAFYLESLGYLFFILIKKRPIALLTSRAVKTAATTKGLALWKPTKFAAALNSAVTPQAATASPRANFAALRGGNKAFRAVKAASCARNVFFDLDLLIRGLKVGFPAGLERLLLFGSFLAFMRIISDFGTEVMAGYQVGLRVESIAFMPGIGFTIAAMSLTGRALGEGNPSEAEKDALFTAFLASVCMGIAGVFMVIFAAPLATIFTRDLAAIDAASGYLICVGFSQIPLGISFVLSGALRGAGDTKTSLIVNFLSMWIFRVLPAFALALLFENIWLIWLVTLFETILRGLWLWIIFKRGKWKKIKV